MFHLDRSFIRGATVQININNCKIAHILEILLMNSYDFKIFRATKKFSVCSLWIWQFFRWREFCEPAPFSQITSKSQNLSDVRSEACTVNWFFFNRSIYFCGIWHHLKHTRNLSKFPECKQIINEESVLYTRKSCVPHLCKSCFRKEP